jgi:carbamoyl-phosphate synthase small subunit
MTTPAPDPKPAKLALQDGTVFTGWSFGADAETEGEVCFNTGMTGYQEILTDPSYRGQIVTMTYPLIGNYGVNAEDVESRRPFVAGFVVKEPSRMHSNFRAGLSLDEYLRRNGIPGLAGIDTRALTRKLRTQGALNGVLSTRDLDDESLIAKARKAPGLDGRDLVAEVLPECPAAWSGGYDTPFSPKDTAVAGKLLASAPRRPDGRPWKVAALDFGAKHNILRSLTEGGCEVTVLPGNTPAEAILERKPDGLFLSNGPGDPAAVQYGIKTIRALTGKLPIFGICLGHQLLGLSLGAGTYKLKFGHRGANQPVLNLDNGRTEITSQNHGYAVDPEQLKKVGGEPTHINLNDGTLEGFRHKELPLFCVQYHPEASPGPHDATYLFAEFAKMMATGKPPKYG